MLYNKAKKFNAMICGGGMKIVREVNNHSIVNYTLFENEGFISIFLYFILILIILIINMIMIIKDIFFNFITNSFFRNIKRITFYFN